MLARHPHLLSGLTLKVELNEHRRFVSDHPPIMPRFDFHNLRSREASLAAVRKLDLNAPFHDEADVSMHAVRRSDRRFDVLGPVETGRIDDALHPTASHPSDVHLNS